MSSQYPSRDTRCPNYLEISKNGLLQKPTPNPTLKSNARAKDKGKGKAKADSNNPIDGPTTRAPSRHPTIDADVESRLEINLNIGLNIDLNIDPNLDPPTLNQSIQSLALSLLEFGDLFDDGMEFECLYRLESTTKERSWAFNYFESTILEG